MAGAAAACSLTFCSAASRWASGTEPRRRSTVSSGLNSSLDANSAPLGREYARIPAHIMNVRTFSIRGGSLSRPNVQVGRFSQASSCTWASISTSSWAVKGVPGSVIGEPRGSAGVIGAEGKRTSEAESVCAHAVCTTEHAVHSQPRSRHLRDFGTGCKARHPNHVFRPQETQMEQPISIGAIWDQGTQQKTEIDAAVVEYLEPRYLSNL